MKTLLTTLLITLSFNSFAGDNLIQQQLKLQQNLIRIQQQNQQAMLPNRQEERREQNLHSLTTTSHIKVIKAITTIAGLLGGTTYGIELKLAPGLTFYWHPLSA